MSRHSILRVFQVAIFAGLLAGTGTMDLGYGLGAFVIVFLGWGGHEVITKQRGGQ